MQTFIALAMAALVLGCDPAPERFPDAGADAGPVAQGSPARGELIVNEVAPKPLDGADWIELFNRSERALDLCDYFVTDSIDRLDHYAPLSGILPPGRCAPVLLDPGEYLVLYADDRAAPGPEHLPFRLGVADEAHVVTTSGLVEDSLIYLYPEGGGGASLARLPDGEGLFHLAEPTPGTGNREDALAATDTEEVMP